MYYAEKVIDGVLHYKTLPNETWKAMTAKQLTDKLLRSREFAERFVEQARSQMADAASF